MNCCILGGSGFIGHHLVNLLSSQGKKLIVMGRNPNPTRILPSGVRYISGNYGDKKLMKEVLTEVDEIVDLSYSSVPKTSYDDPVNDILTNLPSHVNLFEVASLFPIKKIVFVSSGGTIYGKAINLPIKEDHPTEPISPYGITKLVVEKYAKMYHQLKELPVVCVRPSNAYGEGQATFAGQGFITTVISSALQGKEINIFGNNGVVRDYIYVKDVATGILAALKFGRNGESYNIGSGIGLSNYDIIELIRKIIHSKDFSLDVKALPFRPFDVPSNILDSSKLINETGWKPETPILEGLEATWNFYENYFKKK